MDKASASYVDQLELVTSWQSQPGIAGSSPAGG